MRERERKRCVWICSTCVCCILRGSVYMYMYIYLALKTQRG